MWLTESIGVKGTQARAAAALLAAVLAAFFVLNTYWSLGGDWGVHEALGDAEVPPTPVLWAQGVLVLVAIGLVLGRSGIWRKTPVPSWVLRAGVWAQAAVYALVAVMNLLGTTTWERFVFAPSGLILAALAVTVALGPQPPRSRSTSPVDATRVG